MGSILVPAKVVFLKKIISMNANNNEMINIKQLENLNVIIL